MTQGAPFPAFLSIEYDARGVGFPAFEKDANQTFNKVEARGKNIVASFDEIGRAIAGAIKKGGSADIDLGIDKFQKAASEAAAYEQTLLKLSAALKSTATARDATFSDPFAVQIEQAKRATAAVKAQVAVYAELQSALDKVAASSRISVDTRSGISRFAAGDASLDRAAVSARTLDDIMGRVSVKSRSLAADTQRFNELQSRSAKEAGALALELERQSNALRTNVSALDRLLAGKASIDRAAVSGTTLSDVLRRTSTTTPEQRTQFDPQAMARAEQAAKQYALALSEIRQQVDPAYFAQKRFNQELAFADHALKSGDITADQYAKRLAFLRGEMALNAASTRQMRFASVQLGQQLQDVVIQAQMGTNAFVILAQQGSQMAFALTEAGGKVGALARIMAGWQGAIVFAGIALVGQLVPALLGFNKEAKDASKSTIDFTNSLESSRAFVENYADAVKQLTSATRGLINTQALLADSIYSTATAQAGKLESDLKQTERRIAELSSKFPSYTNILNAPGKLSRTAAEEVELYNLKQSVGNLRSSASDARAAAQLAQVALETRQAKESADAAVKAQGEIDRGFAELERRRADTLRMSPVPLQQGSNQTPQGLKPISAVEYQREYQVLLARQKALNESKKSTEGAINAAARLAERGEDAAKKIANITDRFSDMPPQVRSVNSAMRELDDLANDFAKKKPPNYGEIVDMLDKARVAVEEGLNKPFDDLLLTQSRELLVLDLQHKGYVDQAAALQQIFSIETARGKLTDGQKQAIQDNVVAIRLMNRELDIQRQKQQAYLTAVSDVQSAIRNTIAGIRTQGFDSLKGLVSGLRSTFDNLFANVVTEKLFGDLFRDINDQITGAGRVKAAQDIEAAALAKAASKVEAFGNAVAKAANQVAEANGASKGPVAANDNSAATAANDIIVTASRYPTDPGDFLGTVMTRLFQKFLGADSPLAKDIGKLLGDSIEGAAYGQMAGGLVLGSSGSKTGAAIGGALGNIAGKALGKAVGGTLGKALGPLGSIAGGLLGSALGGLFKKAKYGTVAIGANAGGNLSIIGSGGNSGAAIKASTKAGNAIIENIDSIAEQLGGTVDASRGSVSIGQYKGKWRVSTSGYTGKLKVKNGAVDFGKDGAEEAARFAMQDLIRDGVIVGLRAGTQQLLKNAADLEKGLAKALKFEGVFKDLRKFKDPVGAAIDDLNTEFKSLIKIFQEAGATSAETAQLEELYQLRRKTATEDAMKSLTGSLDDLYKGLTIGDNGYSLRTRLGNAQAAYDPLAARVAAGDSTAYNDFAAAAQTLIELKREFSGSTPDYFATLDQVTALTKGELDRQKALYSSAAGSASPFDTKPIVDATQQQTNAIVNALGAQNQAANDNTARILAALQSLGSRGLFMGRANF